MSKTDTLTRIGDRLETYDRHLLLRRTWRVIAHVYCDYLRRVVEMVVLEGVVEIDREEIPR